MKYWKFVIIVYIAVIVSALYLGSMMLSSEKKKLNELKAVELKTNTSALSEIVSYFIQDLKSKMKYACDSIKLSENTPKPNNLKKIYGIFTKTSRLPVLCVGFINKGKLKYIYPAFNLNSNPLSIFENKINAEASFNKIFISKTYDDLLKNNKGEKYSGFIVIKKVLVEKSQSSDFLFMILDSDRMAELIQLPDMIKTDTKFFIAHPDYNHIFCSPHRKYFEELSRTDPIQNLLLNKSKTINNDLNKLFIFQNDKKITCIDKVKNSPYYVVATAPLSNKIKYSSNFTKTIVLFTGVICLFLFLVFCLSIFHKIKIKDLKNEINKLKIEINKEQVLKETEEIIDSNYFKSIKEKLNTINNFNPPIKK